jgi:DDE family transposase
VETIGRCLPPESGKFCTLFCTTARAARWRTALRNARWTCSPAALRRPPCANQLRLWFASLAYVLLCALRRIGLAFTPFARASCGSIRLKLLKIGALVRVSVRRIHLAMASACPYQHEFALAHALLRRAGA